MSGITKWKLDVTFPEAEMPKYCYGGMKLVEHKDNELTVLYRDMRDTQTFELFKQCQQEVGHGFLTLMASRPPKCPHCNKDISGMGFFSGPLEPVEQYQLVGLKIQDVKMLREDDDYSNCYAEHYEVVWHYDECNVVS